MRPPEKPTGQWKVVREDGRNRGTFDLTATCGEFTLKFNACSSGIVGHEADWVKEQIAAMSVEDFFIAAEAS